MTVSNEKVNNDHADITKTRAIFAKGYGLMPKIVAQDRRLTIEAKGIYAYLVSYSGAGVLSFPSKERILNDLNITSARYYRHRDLLVKYGYLKIAQKRSNNGILERAEFILLDPLNHYEEQFDEPCIDNQDTDNQDTDNQYTDNQSMDNQSTDNQSMDNQYSNSNNLNSNILNINIDKSNNKKSNSAVPFSPEQIIKLYHNICISYPMVFGLTEKRKSAIEGISSKYSREQIEEVLHKMEGSDFLKGSNDRGWKASMDWAMSEENFLKILEGRYDNALPKEMSQDFGIYNSIDMDELERVLKQKNLMW